MDLYQIATASVFTGLFAGGLSVLLTAPHRFIAHSFLCAFGGRFTRDLFMSWGLSQNWSTTVAAAVVVLVALAMTRGKRVSPVVLVCGILPLGASVAMFQVIIELMKVSSLTGEALSRSADSLIGNAGKVFTTSLAIALGLAAGIAVAKFVRGEKEDV